DPLYSITYTPPKGIQAKDKLELAKNLVDYIELDKEKIDQITERELKESWYLLNEDKALDLTTDEEKAELENSELYDLSLKRITEDLNELTGINATTDWERDYLYKDTFKDFIGNITTEERGIPKEKKEYFKSRGYNNNDRVGISGLEEQYEEYLKGRKEQIKYT